MLAFLRFFVYWLTRFLLSLRYRTHIQGLEKLVLENFSKKSGILFLPNHPAEIDPVIVSIALWRKFSPRPLVVEWVYNLPVVHYLIVLMKGIFVPDLEVNGSHFKLRKAEESFQEIVDGLKRRENFLFYPAGRLKKTPHEILGGTSGIHKLIEACPDVNIVLVRTTGLWGSSFSKGITLDLDFYKTAIEAVWAIIKNFIFFIPKRHIDIEFVPNPKDFPYCASRTEMNEYLERFYNPPNPDGSIGEPLNLVSLSMWSQKVPLPIPSKMEDINLDEISDRIKLHVQEELGRIAKCLRSEVSSDMRLFADLRFDSLDTQEVVTFLQENYGARNIRPKDLVTVAKVMQIASDSEKHQEVEVNNEDVSVAWGKYEIDEECLIPEGENIGEVFIRMACARSEKLSCADATMGQLTYRKFLRIVIILAKRLKKISEERIGILMPSTVIVNAMILACLLARKIPVMINWTVGKGHIQSLLSHTHIKTVLSSKKFLEALTNIDLDKVHDLILPIEDLKKKISIWQKIKGNRLSKMNANAIIKYFGLQQVSKDDRAVILFTSGSEKLPKGVPLTHENLLSNIKAAMIRAKPRLDDVVLAFLPPFHSFGFAVTGLLPLISGMRVIYYSNPTHYKSMAALIKKWNITFICGAPTFLKGIFNSADKETFKTLRIVVSGAEKAPKSLIELMMGMNSKVIFIEGYGITECSPILTLNIPNTPPKGVGPPLSDIEICIIDIKSDRIVPFGKEGHVLARGPNIFKGYLSNEESPFIIINDRQWYKTGDLGFLDTDGSLTLTGRLKRLVKVGAEIVSLSALENALTKAVIDKAWASYNNGPPLAVCSKEKEDTRPEIHIFMTFDATIEEMNKLVRKGGFSNLYRISQINTIKTIPLMATGKIFYRKLEERLNN